MGSVLVTGGCGFIGSEFVRQWMARESSNVVNLDKLTYAGNLHSLEEIAANPRYTFVHGDIADERCLKEIFQEHQPAAIINFAAESHVDRSID
ncbi:MAG: GDP-mannose 4,6-dehydratase, partial [Pirellulales bacterium]|nr:GDP-mannose 4,6-dehydratase [Pirellulales bacterium]